MTDFKNEIVLTSFLIFFSVLGHFVNVQYTKDEAARKESFVKFFRQLSHDQITLLTNGGFYAKGKE